MSVLERRQLNGASAVESPAKRAEIMSELTVGLRGNVTRFRECELGGLTE